MRHQILPSPWRYLCVALLRGFPPNQEEASLRPSNGPYRADSLTHSRKDTEYKPDDREGRLVFGYRRRPVFANCAGIHDPTTATH